MIASDIFGDVRSMVRDKTSVRWTDANLITYLGDFQDELWVRRRSAFNLTGIPTTIPDKAAAAGDTVYIQDSYRRAAAHYIAWACLLEDSADAWNAKLTQGHWDKFEEIVGQP